jgi:tocopherol cyclase
MDLSSLLPRLYRPAVYQGRKNPDQYFEGWYFKFVDAPGEQVWSFIPGVSFSGDKHCFIQVINATTGQSHYFRFPPEVFNYSRRNLLVRVGENTFTGSEVTLDLQDHELTLKGHLTMADPHPFPVSPLSPGIMGWYRYAPFMECYHGVVSMQHHLTGKLQVNGTGLLFDGGKGYIEKDWGMSMPSDWIWIQSNHFTADTGASFMISLARIPWRNSFFPGFLSFLLAGGKLYRFATYNGSVVEYLSVTDERVTLMVAHRKYSLKVTAELKQGVVLKAPRHGSMEREIRESLVSSVQLHLSDRSGKVIFEGRGAHAGVEIVGDVERYFANND